MSLNRQDKTAHATEGYMFAQAPLQKAYTYKHLSWNSFVRTLAGKMSTAALMAVKRSLRQRHAALYLSTTSSHNSDSLIRSRSISDSNIRRMNVAVPP